MKKCILRIFAVVCAVLVIPSQIRADCTNAPGGMVSWWAGEGNGNDGVGNNPATVSSGVSYGAGEVGQAFNFDGSNANLVIPASASLNVGTNSGFTIEGWIKPSDVSGMHMLFEWSDGANFGVHLTHSQSWFGSGGGPGNLLANIVDSGGGWHPLWSPPGLLTTNSFQHIAMTYDTASGVGRLYLNGAVIASGNLGSFTPETSYTLHVGKRPWDPDFPLYGGLLDEVSLYSRALSQGELQAIYFAGSAGKCHPSGPVATVRNNIHMLPISAIAHGYKINFSANANQTYVIQRAPKLNGPWITLTSVLVDANGIGSYIDTNAPADAAFYRLVAQ